MKRALTDFFERLTRHYGPTHWWPGDTAFEVAVGAVLTQNTAWVNVEKAIANLKRERLLNPKAILACPDERLYDALRPSGYFRIKTIRVRSFCAYLVERYGGSMARMARRPLASLRAELLDVPGIGPETADDILLYACHKPVFVVDAYTRRILSRHGLTPHDIEYHALQKFFESNLASDVALFKEYHGLIVYAGKDFCRRHPKCEGCPLAPTLKQGQPVISALVPIKRRK